ncbi:transcription-repair coupling factor [Inmirania thermothiophila]|uniref:Transcription-repair-coupling factor n=1 Tax=Inmirania thermothiophila TaxID=1750597 RepID=A0A3N1Y4V0_9GAMM|nr:transcription-repair coupling factor [Inmirania thermothiophila]ROR32317.1 transcription-repair coupling factor [Inmirania thermothiophila]
MAREHVSILDPVLPRGSAGRVVWGGLHGSAAALALASAARRADAPLLVLAPDGAELQRLEAELAVFCDASLPLLVYPDWETLPYDAFSPAPEVVSRRLEVLARLPGLGRGIVLAGLTAAILRTPPPDYVAAHSLLVETGQRLSLGAARARLAAAGYRVVPQVTEHGEMAVRGSILDLFPMGSELPYRIDLFDEEIESIRTFDPDSQRSLDRVERVRLLPAREFPADDVAITRFRQRHRALIDADPTRSRVYREVSAGRLPQGIEHYLPLFFEETATLFDYLPAEAPVVTPAGLAEAADRLWADIGARHALRAADPEWPPLAPEHLYLSPGGLTARLALHPRIELGGLADDAVRFATRPPPAVRLEPRAADPARALRAFLEGFPGRVLFAADSPGRREVLRAQLRGHGIETVPVDGWAAFRDGEVRCALAVAPLEEGLVADEPALAVITERQLFGERAAQPRPRRRRAARDPEAVVRDLAELRPGTPVVHEDHGVGRYQGLERMQAGGIEGEYLVIEYAGGDRLYVPVTSLHLVSRYTGAAPENAPLHRLGGEQWKRARRRAAQKVRDVAAELLEIYARRAASEIPPVTDPGPDYAAFCAAFPFEETPDQAAAIDAVLADLRSPTPMDRVVCGDVGFGKTEVAMRAAFVAVQAGRQVAMLVPTTLLAQQHYLNFCDRFADWPVRIEVLSRFRSGRETARVLDALAEGRVDIVIGTHKLLERSVRFRNLGLVIIDEEHRFGVRQKERFKALRAEVDVLTLTATPIPRTLNLALSGLRDLSIITTPPVNRLAVQTFVTEWKDTLVAEAIRRELHRGGQVYFVHNRVESIEGVARRVQALVPEARLRIAHGQMRERELETIMVDFHHHRFDVLVCTTIIESGIDIPRANTILIDRADRLGLAQLHQLRGRVGRSHHRAYAYLLVPPRAAMTADAVKRLEAIESLEALGSGFLLANHDLEIRGAGELLGEEQSGQIQEVGYSLYMDMLARAVAALKAGREPELLEGGGRGPEVELRVPAVIPEDYLPDVHTRLVLYKRIAGAADEAALHALEVEMVDRFGLLPPEVKNLFRLTRLRRRAEAMGIARIEAGPRGGRIEFGPAPRIDPLKLVQLVQGEPGRYRLEGQERLRFQAELPDPEARFALVESLLGRLALAEAA